MIIGRRGSPGDSSFVLIIGRYIYDYRTKGGHLATSQ